MCTHPEKPTTDEQDAPPTLAVNMSIRHLTFEAERKALCRRSRSLLWKAIRCAGREGAGGYKPNSCRPSLFYRRHTLMNITPSFPLVSPMSHKCYSTVGGSG